MRRTSLWSALLTAIGLLALSPASDARDLSLEDVLSRYEKARGGKAWEQTQVLKIRSEVSAFGVTVLSTEYKRRPSQYRISAHPKARKHPASLIVFDGRRGYWTGFGKEPSRQVIPENELQGFLESADFDGPLTNWKAKAHRVALLGREFVGRREAWLVEAMLKSGTLLHVYLDVETYLPIKKVSKSPNFNSEVITLLRDYRKVDGLMIAHRREIHRPDALDGDKGSENHDVLEVEVNPTEATEAFFRFEPGK
ncbi:MAG: hypothetical protein AAGD06_08240 [Acidobacteriota bacterium]